MAPLQENQTHRVEEPVIKEFCRLKFSSWTPPKNTPNPIGKIKHKPTQKLTSKQIVLSRSTRKGRVERMTGARTRREVEVEEKGEE